MATFRGVREPVVPVADLYPVLACCCAMGSFYCKYPDCLGLYSQQVFGCCHAEQIFCKPLKEKTYCWTNTKLECLCRSAPTCSRLNFQACCIDLRCGIPAAEQHPYLCTVLFCTIYADGEYRSDCCQPISNLIAAHAMRQRLVAPPAAPTAPPRTEEAPAHISFDGPVATALPVSGTREDVPMGVVIAEIRPFPSQSPPLAANRY